jgi:hypothetical protein
MRKLRRPHRMNHTRTASSPCFSISPCQSWRRRCDRAERRQLRTMILGSQHDNARYSIDPSHEPPDDRLSARQDDVVRLVCNTNLDVDNFCDHSITAGCDRRKGVAAVDIDDRRSLVTARTAGVACTATRGNSPSYAVILPETSTDRPGDHLDRFLARREVSDAPDEFERLVVINAVSEGKVTFCSDWTGGASIRAPAKFRADRKSCARMRRSQSYRR